VTTVMEKGGGTRAVCEADLQPKGVVGATEPFVRSTFARMGDDAPDAVAKASR
jgi:hypothetical protein